MKIFSLALLLAGSITAGHALAAVSSTREVGSWQLYKTISGKSVFQSAYRSLDDCDAGAKALSIPFTYVCRQAVDIKVSVVADPNTPPAAWLNRAPEGGSFVVMKDNTQVRYGVTGAYATKTVMAGTVLCSNALFGDPKPGVIKSCDAFITQADLPPTPPTPVPDHSMMGPMVDASKIPEKAVGFSGPRIKSTWTDQAGADCLPGAAGCGQAPGNIVNGPHPNDIGAFRVPCGLAVMKRDDPIVFPGQPGKSHLHTFFGNVDVDAFTTPASILTGNSTCAGGTLNRSAYWIPTMVDTTDGTPLIPTSNNVYYKCTYELSLNQACDQMQPVPAGLRMVTGSAKNTDPNNVRARYMCLGPKGENPGWKSSITAAFADGTCLPGGDFVMNINFPVCWDGVNLDSPNHSSHIVDTEQYQKPDGQWDRRCPAGHTVVIPAIAYNIHYAPVNVDKWRLSSDMDPALPAGISGHADYFMGWDPKTMETFIQNCDRAHSDCHDYLLGNGTTLY